MQGLGGSVNTGCVWGVGVGIGGWRVRLEDEGGGCGWRVWVEGVKHNACACASAGLAP